MINYTVKKQLGGGLAVISETENIANFGKGPQSQQAFAIWLEGAAKLPGVVVTDYDTGAALAGDVGQFSGAVA